MKFFYTLLISLIFVASAVAAPHPVTMTFEVPPSLTTDDVYVMFVNTSLDITGSYIDCNGTSKTLAINTSYRLSDIASPTGLNGAPANTPAVALDSYVSGRVYLSIGSPLVQVGAPGQPPQPVANLTTDPNYNTRYQYFEPTIKLIDGTTDTGLWIDITYIDFTSISLSMELINASTGNNSPQRTTVSGTELVRVMSLTAASGEDNVRPTGAGILPDPTFARVVAPNINGNYYPSWSNYLTFLSGKSASIRGLFGGAGKVIDWDTAAKRRQTYDYTATFNATGGVVLTANPGSGDGNAACIPADLRGTGVGDVNESITITNSQLTDVAGIYGCNPNYTINNNGVIKNATGLTNDMFGWVVGDLMAGLNFGFVGSTQAFNATDNVGDLDSANWWGGNQFNGDALPADQTPAGQGLMFNKVQTNSGYYNNYAAALLPMTPGYGFPLQDRLNANLMTYNASTDTNGYVKVTINSDNSGSLSPQYLMLLGN